jgi:hypothetical protein
LSLNGRGEKGEILRAFVVSVTAQKKGDGLATIALSHCHATV